MARLYRPYMPLSVKVEVAERDLLKYFTIEHRMLAPSYPLKQRLEWLLAQIARAIGCGVNELRFDHDPPLGARPQERRGLAKPRYIPDANCPDHIFIRPHGTQFEGSHDRKTRITGDHGQFSDVTLIKRARRRQRRENPTPAQKKLAAAKQKRRERAKKLRHKIKQERKQR